MDGQNSILSVVGPLATTASSLRLVIKALLSQQPWLHDPAVHELPWRYDLEREILELTGGIGDASKAGKISFGVLRSDGVVNPVPPVLRAIDIVVQALQSLGHEVVEWKPPSHAALLEQAFKTWVYDAGKDVKSAFALSGEPMAPQIAMFESLSHESSASEIAAVNVRLRELKKEYMEYWNSTQGVTTTGRPVDAVICPVAPFPSARREKYSYYGYSTFVNLLDYTSVIVPVTNVDKAVDKVDEGYKPINDQDKGVHESCELLHLSCSLRMLGRETRKLTLDRRP